MLYDERGRGTASRLERSAFARPSRPTTTTRRLNELDLGEGDVGADRDAEGGDEEAKVEDGGGNTLRGGENLLGGSRDDLRSLGLGAGHGGTC